MEKTEKKLRKGNFSMVEKIKEGYKVSKSYNSMIVSAKVNEEGIVLDLDTNPTGLTLLLGFITLPIGTVILLIYYLTRIDQRKRELKSQIENQILD